MNIPQNIELKKICKLSNHKKHNHVERIWSIDLMDMSGYKTSNKKRFRYIVVIRDKRLKKIRVLR